MAVLRVLLPHPEGLTSHKIATEVKRLGQDVGGGPLLKNLLPKMRKSKLIRNESKVWFITDDGKTRLAQHEQPASPAV